jgi:hypothetical protein
MFNWLKNSTALTPVGAGPSGASAEWRGISLRVLGASVAVTSALAMPVIAEATPFTPPAGVTDYRLVFITSDATTAESNNILYYNNFATAAAALNPSLPATTWTAIASTAFVDAATNISCGAACDSDVPIYLIDGTTEVAASADALFAGSILHVISEDENGMSQGPYAWTGSNGNGTADIAAELGSADPVVGANNDSLSGTINVGVTLANTDMESLYAISAEIAVPAVPEPMSAALLGFGVLATGLAGRFRRRRRSAD